jgi:CRP-like cAMP-binding protein
MPELLGFLTSINPLSNELTARLQEIIKEKEFTRKSFLLKAGRICNNLYFVKKGLFRASYRNESRDISFSFMKEGTICVDLESYTRQTYSEMNIQALEDSLVQYLSREHLEKLYHDFPIFNRIGRILAEKCLLFERGRIKGMWMQKAQDRYDWFRKNFPELVARVPGKYLASYIGMTEEMLSRIKQKIDN